jgi:hypothetical protein
MRNGENLKIKRKVKKKKIFKNRVYYLFRMTSPQQQEFVCVLTKYVNFPGPSSHATSELASSSLSYQLLVFLFFLSFFLHLYRCGVTFVHTDRQKNWVSGSSISLDFLRVGT